MSFPDGNGQYLDKVFLCLSKKTLKGQNVLSKEDLLMQVKKKLLDKVRDKIRFKYYSLSRERKYIHWIKHYIFYHNKKHSVEMGKEGIEAFLIFSAVDKKSIAHNSKSSLFSLTVSIQRSSWC